MKKLFSFVMALAMVTSLVATPKVALPNKSAKKARTELTLSAVQKQQPQVKDVAKKNIVRKAVNRKAALETTATFTFASLEDANKTVSGVTLAIAQGSGTSSPAWNDNSNHLRIYANNTIAISGSGITKIELTFGKTKTSAAYADLTANVGALVSGGTSTDVGDFKTDTWTGTADEVVFSLGASGQRAVEKIVVYTDGDTPTPPTPGEPIYTIINHPLVMDSIADFGWIYASGGNDEYSLGIQVNTDHLLGEFTSEDIEMEYTQMIDWVAYDYVDIESIPSVVIAQVGDTLRFTVTVEATDGQVYVITMNDFVTQPTGEETYVNIMLPEVYNMTAEEGWFQAMGYDVTGEYYASICANATNMFGNFTDADMDWEYTSLYIGETAVQLIENSISVIVSTVSDTVVYRGEVLDVDGMKWIITMKNFTPTPAEVINLVTVEAEGEYYAEDGDYYATGVTAAGDQIALDIYMDKLASGTFTIDDVETYYSGITLADGTLVEFYSADITLTVSGDDVTIEAVIIGRDVKQYNVTMLIAGTPTPVGDEITPEQALEIGNALADNATTTTEYRVVGIVSYANNYNTQYGSQTFSMSGDGADSKSNFKAYQCYIDAPGVQVGNKVAVTGKILKYVDKNGTTIEIKQGTVEILDTPTPPTPVGDEITVAQAEEIAGALAEGATTTETYTINGYVGTLYDEGDFWLVSEAGGRSDLKVYRPTVDRALTKGDQVQVVGQLQKYVSKSGNVTLEVVNATVTHVGGDVPPTPTGDVTITGLNYVDAVFYADETYGDYWAFDFYKELDEEGYILSPYVYFICEESTTSGTKIAGTWTAYDAGYFATDDEESGIYTDEEVPVGSLTVTCVSQGVYNFVGSFVGEDGKTYTWTLNNMDVYAYNGDTYEDITLTDGGTPTPPTPVGDEITVAQAEAIAGALAEGATTTETYTIVCYAGTTYSYSEQFENQDFWLVDTNGDKSQTLEAYRSKVDKVVAEGDYISITGQLQKYKAKTGKIILEVVNGTTKHLSATALLKIMQNAKVKKMLKQGKVIILRDNQIFDLSGMQIK